LFQGGEIAGVGDHFGELFQLVELREVAARLCVFDFNNLAHIKFSQSGSKLLSTMAQNLAWSNFWQNQILTAESAKRRSRNRIFNRRERKEHREAEPQPRPIAEIEVW
jgi:hypothetical protein